MAVFVALFLLGDVTFLLHRIDVPARQRRIEGVLEKIIVDINLIRDKEVEVSQRNGFSAQSGGTAAPHQTLVRIRS